MEFHTKGLPKELKKEAVFAKAAQVIQTKRVDDIKNKLIALQSQHCNK